MDGYFTYRGATTWIGTNTSNIQSVLLANFPNPTYTQMTKNTKDEVWLTSTSSLSFLELTGTYLADVPLVLPHQFMLVMKDAVINAHADFPTNTVAITAYGCTISANASPDTNKLSISVTNWGIIVFKASYYSGVISPAGRSASGG